jgi:hypothetical protein
VTTSTSFEECINCALEWGKIEHQQYLNAEKNGSRMTEKTRAKGLGLKKTG